MKRATINDVALTAGVSTFTASRALRGKDHVSHAGQKYTSDGVSMAVVKSLASGADVPLQYFANRSDKAGGSTLGNIAMAQASMNAVDIGLPQLAMHSSYETAGIKDTYYAISLMKALFDSHIQETSTHSLEIKR